MKEEIAHSQLKLAKDLSQFRVMQFAAIENAAKYHLRSVGKGDLAAVAATALFLASLGAGIERMMQVELENATHQMERLSELPDETQWEYRCAHTTGVCEGINRLGAIMARMIERAQGAVHQVAILHLAGNACALSATSRSAGDYLKALKSEITASHGQYFSAIGRRARSVSSSFRAEVMTTESDADPTVSCICISAADVVMANLMEDATGNCLEAIEKGKFLVDPAGDDTSKHTIMARKLAASVILALIIDAISLRKPTLLTNLN